MKLLEVPPSPPPRTIGRRAKSLRDYEWFGTIPFIAIHLLSFGAIWTGIGWTEVAVCLVLFWARVFFVTGFYHRYFSHRTFKTSRVMQFIMAFLAQTTAQKGALWWAAHHRDHHKYSDQIQDVHSPKQWGFWHAHVGWLFDNTAETDYQRVKDMSRYPELVFLNKFGGLLPAIALGVGVWALFGWSGLWFGFMFSTVLTWHATFTINSLSHVFGSQRFETTDTSRNNFLLALLTLGEGWHNNHHYYMNSTRQGFYWWEIDITYYLLKLMSWVGLVWDIKEPPAKVYAEAARLKELRKQRKSDPGAAPAAPSITSAA